MFHFDVTMEDTRLIVRESDESWPMMECSLHDAHTGKTFKFNAGIPEVSELLFMMTHPDSDEFTNEATLRIGDIRENLNRLLKDCPVVCLPIPLDV